MLFVKTTFIYEGAGWPDRYLYRPIWQVDYVNRFLLENEVIILVRKTCTNLTGKVKIKLENCLVFSDIFYQYHSTQST